MSESKHTAGPWEMRAEIDRLCAINTELLEALKEAYVLVQMAYKTPEWLRECRSEESDDALDFIQRVLAAAERR